MSGPRPRFPEAQRQVAEHYACLAVYYRTPLPDAVIAMYVDDLSDLPVQDVLAAMFAMRREPKRNRLPLPAEVRGMVEGPEAGVLPEQVATLITGCMSRFGYTQPERARERIGELGWSVVENMGGWTQLCQSMTTAQMPTFAAQAREAVRCRMDGARRQKMLEQGAATAGLPSIAPRGRSLLAQ